MRVDALCTLSREVSVFCCIGIQSRRRLKTPFDMLWLYFLLFMIPGVRGTCQSCFGDAPDCSGSTANCPWVKDVANNVIAVTAAAGGVLLGPLGAEPGSGAIHVNPNMLH